ncbi:SH3 domain-containing protein [Flavivirga jejuensis]|uniref:SH3 domain-containing protein n=1 Tax=Flavivirga jejuensis TaxID=870487 RepID=A0ABT8WL87_9FLAO|nr:SH3 domain-containing protein [Flavivirga jejuensis]MDO5973721.1 SH3 domain-containing protein [Flavivirga jejuensis]
MKRLLLIIFLVSKIGFGQDTKYLYENYEFKNGEIVYMFGNDVKLRDQPNTESIVLSLLKIGNEVEIIEKTDNTMLFDGIESPWYKVKAQDKIGFVLGALISMDKAIFSNLTYLISLKKDGSNLFLKTRLLENDKEYIENISQLLTDEFSIKASGNKGLDSIKSVFEIDYLAESCGVNGGGIYLFFDGNELVKAIDYTQVADADLYWLVEEYIFPKDKDGKKGKILYKKEIGETKEYETEWVEIKLTQRILEWDGKQIFPNIETEEN